VWHQADDDASMASPNLSANARPSAAGADVTVTPEGFLLRPRPKYIAALTDRCP
jgi:hypothetical protein